MNVSEILLDMYVNRLRVNPDKSRRVCLILAVADLEHYMEYEDRIISELRSKFEREDDPQDTLQ